jgi:beta-N-acetylhexosaminidase
MFRQPIRAAMSRRALATLIAVALLAAACGDSSSPSPSTQASPLATVSPSPAGALPTPTSRTSTPTPVPTSSPSAQASCAQHVVTGMTLAQRVGQVFSLGLANNQLGSAELGAIQDQHVGSVWFTATTSVGVAGIKAVTDAVQAQATTAATGRVGFLIAANQEGGQIQALRGSGFSLIPSAVVQGGWSVRRLTASATLWGQQLAAAGINMDFAPVADVVPPGTDSTNQPIGVLQREYGHDPATAGSHAAAFIAGMTAAGVATTGKHFPGLGRVTDNTDFAAGVVDDVTTANDPYLASFKATITAGVPFVMIALATYTRIDANHLAAFSSTVIEGILRGTLGFHGVVVSDSLTATAVSSMTPGDRAIEFLLAGGDLVVARSASVVVQMVAAVTARASSDASFAAVVTKAALLVLQAKRASGLLPCSG